MTEDSTLGFPMEADLPGRPSAPETQLVARIFLVALGALLLGYMFLGRGFAHVGIGPIYIGDGVLLLGVAASALVAIRGGIRPPITWTIAFLLAFAALGALRTVPYIGTYGLNALRDATLWGYAGFALIVYLLADRRLLLGAFRLYGWVVPIFALWLPISWNLFAAASAEIDPNRPGSVIPLVFFKGGDMAVHAVGAIAFLVLGASPIRSARSFMWRMLIGLPLLWTVFVAGTSNRGALVTAAAGIIVIALLGWRSRNWVPLLAAPALLAIALVIQGVLAASGGTAPTTTVEPTVLAVQNPGFELGPLDDGSMQGWTPRGERPPFVVEGGAYAGDRYAYMRNTGGKYEDTITSSRIRFKDGPDVAVSLWVKAVAGRPILEIYMNWYDSSGTLISSVLMNSLATDGVRDWQELTGALAVPANVTQAEIKLYEGAGNATMGIDEVTVRSGDFPTAPNARPATLQQMIENVLSIFTPSSNSGLEGSKQFRLAWWGKILDYTVFGKNFWTGKGFGVNLADADGFQSTSDHSLRSPHNSEMTVLARMGVPGLILWLLLQGTFAIGLLRATLSYRHNGDIQLAAVGAWLFVYWFVMSVDTSFDPYLEGPQGGIWFWAIFGLGLVFMRLVPARRVTA